ncbi:hypothetical protein ABT160_36465 [Streptomyces sp. NPDC001941]|uniref:hypothetical protein n=1 Tax=Streptomyces sp. NPDC001941 TaxID=3154659 RepID=UPI003316E94A
MASLRGAGRSLKRLVGRAGGPAARLDGGDPLAPLAKQAAEHGDWPTVRQLLEERPEDEDRTGLLWAVSEAAGVEQWIPGVIEAEKDSALPVLVAGVRHVSWGWEARSAARASHVSREQFQVFHERLRVAEEHLYEAAEREPGWASPWYALQVSGRGLEVGQEVARRRFDATVRRYPHHLGAHQQQLQQLCAKWSGSHEEMHAFARRSMLDAPGGSLLGQLVAIAHVEHWLHLESGEDAAYIGTPEVNDSLREALERSLLHPDCAFGTGWVQTANTFAMAFALAGEQDSARDCFDLVDGSVSEFPWSYLGGDPVEAFRKYRSAAR